MSENILTAKISWAIGATPAAHSKYAHNQIPDLTGACIGFHFTTHCIVDQKPEMLQTDAFCEHPLQCSKNATATGLCPRPDGGAYSASPAGLKEVALWR